MTPKEIFNRGAWQLIPKDDDVGDVLGFARQPLTNDHAGDHGEVIRRMLAAGVSASDIARLRRIEWYFAVQRMFVYFHDAMPAYDGFPPGEREMWWRLQAVDVETGEVVADLDALHQSFLEEDPLERSMRPPGRGT